MKKIKTNMSEDGKNIRTSIKSEEHIEMAVFKLEQALKLTNDNGSVYLSKLFKNHSIEMKKARLDYLKMLCGQEGLDWKEII